MSLRRRGALVLAAACAGAWLLALAGGGMAPAAAASTGPASWTVYHGDAEGSGSSLAVASVDTTAPAWTSPVLDGQLYGEPLVWSGDVYVATENDTVDALSGTTGAVVWSTHVASPVPASDLPCGDIAPTVGITGTPVIDQARNEIFVVADELVGGKPQHDLVGLNTRTGAVELSVDVDAPGSEPAAQLQRTGLNLSGGQVVFGVGGNDGDCPFYRGRVTAVPETGGTPTFFTVDAAAGDSEGAIWMGGAAPAVDASGNIWVSVGNGSVSSPRQAFDDSDSVLELSPSLQLLQYFAPTTVDHDNADDLDMSMAPALLSDGQVVLAGKSRIVYLLNGTHLGGIGGQETSLGAACSQDIDGGSAVVGTTIYLPCLHGTVAVQVGATPPSLSSAWSASAGGGPPIVAGGLVWSIGQNGILYGLDASNGTVRQQASIGVPANHFPTPSVGDGLLLAPSATQVVAFRATAPATSTTTTSTATTTTTAPPHQAAPPPASTGGGLSSGAIAGIVIGAVAVAALLGTATALNVRRRRQGAPPP